MSAQSTRHVLMIEPSVFYANTETMETNHYQVDDDENLEVIFEKALKEFHNYHKALIDSGVYVTCIKGNKECPDHVFPNWFSTHSDGTYCLYPMINENRRKERQSNMIAFLEKMYKKGLDFTSYEKEGKALESNGSLCLDRINKKVYSAISKRTDPDLVHKWAKEMKYEPIIFETKSHAGQPVYHVDIVMFIGTGYAGICSQAILPEYRSKVLESLAENHEIVDLSIEQMKHFAGNSLELLGHDDKRILVMSDEAYDHLGRDQINVFLKYVERIVHPQIPTFEKYGGGSARCMLQELM